MASTYARAGTTATAHYPLGGPPRMARQAVRRSLLVTVFACASMSAAFAQIPGTTVVNGNGHTGPITIIGPGIGGLTGTFYALQPSVSPLMGHYGSGSRWFVALRGDPANPSQAWIGRFNSSQSFVEGNIHTLRAVEGGGSAWRNIFAFRGNRPGPAAPTSPGSLPRQLAPSVFNTHPSTVSGVYRMTGNGVPGDLRINQRDGRGHIAGTIYGSDRIAGHYAWQTGTVTFVRYRGSDPIQVFVGTAKNPAAPELEGSFFPLNPSGGSSNTRSALDWETTSVIPTQPRSGLLRQLPNLLTTTGSGAVTVVASARGMTNRGPDSAPQVIETHCPLNQGLTFFTQRAIGGSRVNVSPGEVVAVATPNHRQEIFWLCGVPSLPFQPSQLNRTICDSPGANFITISRGGSGTRIRTRCYWSPDVPF